MNGIVGKPKSLLFIFLCLTLLAFGMILLVSGIIEMKFLLIFLIFFVAAGVVLRDPTYGLYLIILAIPFDSYYFELGSINLSASNVLILLTLISISFQVLTRKRSIEKDFNYILLIWILTAAFATAFIALDKQNHMREIVTIIGCLLTYFLVVNVTRDQKTLWKCLNVLMLSILIVSLISIIRVVLLKYFGMDLGFGKVYLSLGQKTILGYPRVTSTYLDPNAFGCFLVSGLPMIVYFAITRKGKSKLFYITISILGTVALLLSYSRGAWIGMAVALVVLLGILVKRRSATLWPFAFATTIALVLLIFIIFGGSIIQTVYAPLRDLNPESAETRLGLWSDAWGTFAKYPIFGNGFGGFLLENSLLTHSTFFQLLAALGLFGLIPFLLLILRSFVIGFKEAEDEIGVALLVSLIGLLVGILFIDALFYKSLWLLIGFIVANERIRNMNDKNSMVVHAA